MGQRRNQDKKKTPWTNENINIWISVGYDRSSSKAKVIANKCLLHEKRKVSSNLTLNLKELEKRKLNESQS